MSNRVKKSKDGPVKMEKSGKSGKSQPTDESGTVAEPGKPEKATKARKPKKKCCLSKKRCKRCPIRMLATGDLPPGYTVKKLKLVKIK